MHKYFFNILLFLLPIGSCDDMFDQYGYPANQDIQQEGGEVVVSGSKDKNMRLRIFDSDGVTGEYRGDSMYTEYKWLTAIHIRSTSSIKLIAKPNNEGEVRTLGVRLFFDDNKQGQIIVNQQP